MINHKIIKVLIRLIPDKPERKTCHGESSGESDWGKSGKAKRVRTIFTPEQLERLEAEFERQQYMVGTERYTPLFFCSVQSLKLIK